VSSRCSRCKRFKASDGLLLCPRCGPTSGLRQDATVRLRTVIATVTISGDQPPPRSPRSPVSSKVKATVKRAGRKARLTATEDRGEWNNDRQAFEIREMVIDCDGDKYYSQEWRNPDTGETTFKKQGRLDDPKMHGRESHKPTSPADGCDADRNESPE